MPKAIAHARKAPTKDSAKRRVSKSSYQVNQEVRAARAEGKPVWFLQAHGWRWGVYIAPVFACREDAEAEAARLSACGGWHFSVEQGS